MVAVGRRQVGNVRMAAVAAVTNHFHPRTRHITTPKREREARKGAVGSGKRIHGPSFHHHTIPTTSAAAAVPRMRNGPRRRVRAQSGTRCSPAGRRASLKVARPACAAPNAASVPFIIHRHDRSSVHAPRRGGRVACYWLRKVWCRQYSRACARRVRRERVAVRQRARPCRECCVVVCGSSASLLQNAWWARQRQVVAMRKRRLQKTLSSTSVNPPVVNIHNSARSLRQVTSVKMAVSQAEKKLRWYAATVPRCGCCRW